MTGPLFHYCSTQVFQSIIETRTIRLSSMRLSNDAMEGRWSLDMFRKLCVEKAMHPFHMNLLFSFLDDMPALLDGLAFCFSAHGDMLSQWRGYADDGFGFSIGFSKAKLDVWKKAVATPERGITLLPVSYSMDHNRKHLEEKYSEIYEKLKMLPVPSLYAPIETAPRYNFDTDPGSNYAVWNEAVAIAEKLAGTLYFFKNPAFSEEAEWRFLTHLAIKRGDKFEVHATHAALKPFLPFPLADAGADVDLIEQVILGPKNTTPIPIVEAFLTQKGFKNICVTPSTATYR
ncbi:MAG: DUF2971 domain-containing protein [Phyllobacterium sp.]